MKPDPVLKLSLIAAAAFALAGCPQRHGHEASAPDPPPFGPDLHRPIPEGSPERAWADWLQRGDTAAAAAAFEALVDAPSPRPLARFGLAEVRLHQGRIAEAAEQHALLLEASPDDPLARTAAQRLLQLKDQTPGWTDRALALLDALKGRPMDSGARALLGLVDLKARHVALRRSAAPEVFDGAPAGFAQRWRIAGPFSIYPYHDRDRPFPEAEDAPLKKSYKINDFERPTREILFDEPVGDPTFALTGIYYLETWMHLDAPTEALAQREASAGARVWIGDKLLFDKAAGHYGPHRFGAPVRLGAGIHRVLVRLGVQRGDERFALVFTPSDGQPSTATFKAEPAARAEPASVEILAPAPAPDYFGGAPESADHCFVQWLAAIGATEARDADTAIRALDDAEAACPDFPPLALARAAQIEADEGLPQQVRHDRAAALTRQAVERDPEAGLALDRLAGLLEELQQDEALKMLERAQELAPDELSLHFHRYRLLRDRGWTVMARKALDRAFALDPTSCSLAEALWAEWGQEERWKTPEALPAGIAGCDASQEGLAANHDLPRGDVKAAIGRYEALVARNPRAVNQRLFLASLYARQGRHAEAEAAFEESARLANNPSDARMRQFDAVLAGQGADKAGEALKAWLKESPGSYNLRRVEALQAGQNVLEDLRVEGRGVVERYLEQPVQTDTAAVYLLDYAAVRIFEDGSSLTLTHNIIRVNNKEGIDQHGEVDIPGEALVLSLRTIKPDGRVMEPEFIPGKPTISMPNLADGDFIEFEYLEATGASATRASSYLGVRFFFNIFDAPLLRSEYIIETPASWGEATIDYRQDAPRAEVGVQGDRRRYRFLTLRGPRARSEPEAVPAVETIPSILLAHRYGWADAWRTYRDRILSNARSSALLWQEARQIAGAGDTELERARAAFEFVNTRIDDDGSGVFAQPAAHVLASGTGDRLVVLKALLDLMEIDNEVVMGRNWGRDQKLVDFPEIDNWTFTFLRARLDGQEVWLDPAYNHTAFGYIPPILQGNLALTMGEVEGEGPTRDQLLVKVPVMAEGSDRHSVKITLAVDARGDAVGMVEETHRGRLASQMRRVLDEYTDMGEFSTALARSMAASFPGLEVSALNILDRGDADAPLRLTYRIAARGIARVEGDALVIDRAFFPAALGASYATLPERQLPVAVLDPIDADLSLQIAFPEGYAVTEAPRAADLDSDFGALLLTPRTSNKPNMAGLDRSLRFPIQRVSTEAYELFKKFTTAVDEAERLRVRALRQTRQDP